MLFIRSIVPACFELGVHSVRGYKKLPVLTLYTKNPCSLCDVAKEEISVYQDRFKLVTVDITEDKNKQWWSKYKFDIPVFHFEGDFLMWHKADLILLERALQAFEKYRS